MSKSTSDSERPPLRLSQEDRCPGPVVMVDDSALDVMIAEACHADSSLANPFVPMAEGGELLRFLEGVRSGDKELPLAVLLDINMPGMDGFEVLAAVRGDESFRELLYIIMLTHSDSPADIERSRELGATGFQTKPYRQDQYVALFDSLAC